MSKDGRDAHYAAFAELRELDYIQHLPCTENPDMPSSECTDNPDTSAVSCTENPEIAPEFPENPDTSEKVVSPLDNPPSPKEKKRLLQVVVQKKEKRGSGRQRSKRSWRT